MAEEETTSSDSEITKDHLLSIVYELTNIKLSEACLKLDTDKDLVIEWANQLQKEELVEISKDGLGEDILRITKFGLKKLQKLQTGWNTQQLQEDEKNKVKQKRSNPLKSVSDIIKKLLAGEKLELLVAASAILSIYFLWRFYQDPNVQVLSFLAGSLLLSIAFTIYNRYRKQMKKAQEIISFMQWMRKSANENQKSILLAIVGIFIIYSMGMLLTRPEQRSLYIILSVVFASTAELIYYPRKTPAIALEFYAAVTTMVLGLLLLTGFFSLTGLLLESPERMIDLFFGMGLVVLVYLNDKKLLTSIIDRSKIEFPKIEEKKK